MGMAHPEVWLGFTRLHGLLEDGSQRRLDLEAFVSPSLLGGV